MAADDSSAVAIGDVDVARADDHPLLRVVDHAEELPVRVANALGAAWSTFQLHPDPRGRVGFDAAVDNLAAAPALEYLAVAPEHFEYKGTPVMATHGGTGRLIEQLFLIGIAAIEFVEAPTGDDLFHLFDTVRRPRPELDEEGGAAALLRDLTTAVRLIEKRALVEEAEPHDSNDAPDLRTVANPIDFSGDPEGLAAALVAASGTDPARFADLVIRSYERVHFSTELLDERDREEIVHTFVDMFFYLPARLQAPLLSGVLSHHGDEPFRTFLDQFATHELNALAPLLDSDTHPLLHEYARICSQDVDRPTEVTQLLDSVMNGTAIDEFVERRITEVLGNRSADSSTSPSFRRLIASLPDRARYRAVGIGVFKGLMLTSTADHDRRRMLRIWVGKVVSAIKAGSPDGAHDWLDAALADDAMSDQDRRMALSGLSRVIGLPVVTDLAEMIHADPESESAVDLLRRLAPYAAPHVVELLGHEPDRGRRRQLIEMAVEVARIDPQAFITGLADPRWYLIRNLAIILGHSEHPEVVPHLHELRRHMDERVRREAIRGIYTLVRDTDIRPFIEALGDPDPGVRKVATTLLRSSQPDGLAELLEEALAMHGSTEVKIDIVGVLASVPTDAAREVLMRVRDSRAPRAVRNAADMALEGAA